MPYYKCKSRVAIGLNLLITTCLNLPPNYTTVSCVGQLQGASCVTSHCTCLCDITLHLLVCQKKESPLQHCDAFISRPRCMLQTCGPYLSNLCMVRARVLLSSSMMRLGGWRAVGRVPYCKECPPSGTWHFWKAIGDESGTAIMSFLGGRGGDSLEDMQGSLTGAPSVPREGGGLLRWCASSLHTHTCACTHTHTHTHLRINLTEIYSHSLTYYCAHCSGSHNFIEVFKTTMTLMPAHLSCGWAAC